MKIYSIGKMSTRVAFVLISFLFAISSCADATEEKSSEVEQQPIIMADSNSESVHCNDSSRYYKELAGGGNSNIDLAEYHNKVEAYRSTLADKDRGGFFISKRALDQIFDMDARANGIYIDLFRDENDSLNIIVTGTTSQKTRISGTGNAFVAQSYCPEDCSSRVPAE